MAKSARLLKTEEVRSLLIESKGSFDHICGVLVLGQKPPIAAFSDSFVDLHHSHCKRSILDGGERGERRESTALKSVQDISCGHQ